MRRRAFLPVVFLVFGLAGPSTSGETSTFTEAGPGAPASTTDGRSCSSLDETACAADPLCRPARAHPCAILVGPSEKAACDFGAARKFLSCEDAPRGCAAHEDEQECLADASCAPHYVNPCPEEEAECPVYAACLDQPTPAALETPMEVARPSGVSRGQSRYLRVLYYNLNWGNATKYEALSSILLQKVQEGTAPDLVLLQESFWDEGSATEPYPVFRRMLGSAYPHQVPGPMRAGSRLFGSGLVVLSRVPVTAPANVPYSACAGIDCYARKGAELARVNLGLACGDVAFFNTHTQAGKRGDYWPLPIDPAVARLRQVNELAGFVRQQIGTAAPVIAGGDLNLFARANDPSDTASYRILTEDMGLVNAEAYCSAHPTGCRAPYPIGNGLSTPLIAFTRDSSSRGVRIVPLEFIKHPSNAWGGLSDHSVLEVTYRVTCGAIATEK